MLVLVNGLPYFGKQLVKDLNEFDSKRTYIFLDTYYSKIAQIIFFILVPFSKLVISFNGVSDNSGSLNWVLRWKKKMIMQWQGSDVMLAKERFYNGTILMDYINYSTHVTDFDYLKKELEEIGIKSKILSFKHLTTNKLNINYDKISILSYVGKNNEGLYGIDFIIEAAKVLVDIEFNIIGTNAINYDNLPENLFVHGWKVQSEVIDLMKINPIFLRMTKHDGNALSVYEALSLGCEVIWTYPSEFTNRANNSSELIYQILELKNKIEERKMAPNFQKSALVLKSFDKKVVISNYVKFINTLL